MKKSGVIVINKNRIPLAGLALLLLVATLLHLYIEIRSSTADTLFDPSNRLIVIDPGHGGIDGGTSAAGVLEKDINLAVSKLLKATLEEKGYNVIMTREKDISLDSLCDTGEGRHHKDLKARTGIINKSNAQLFLSVHVNSNFNKPGSDGSIVFYSEKIPQSKVLAYCIQRPLNKMVFNNTERTVRDPQKADYFVLKNSNIPGVIIETAFISNNRERELLVKEEFRASLATAIANGVDTYYKELNGYAVK